MINRKIRVLVVDDSPVFREILSKGISSDAQIEVVAKAEDAFDARDKIIEFNPDVMTCDVEMPKMNGIDFIRKLMPQYPLPIVVVSSVSNVVFDAMNAGAVDFVSKPNVQSCDSVEGFINELIAKIKVASIANLQQAIKNKYNIKSDIDNNINANYNNKIIAIGASTGGIQALQTILKSMSPNTPGIVIVQHIPRIYSLMLADRLNNSTSLKVKEAETGDFAEMGTVLIAPGDKHMSIKKVGEKYMVECFKSGKVSGHCPSIDVLFESVSKEAGKNAIGVILTGMGYDGTKGLLSMRRQGARTIGQDEKSCVVYGMPKVAYDIGAVEKQVSVDKISKSIYSMLQK